MELLLSFLFGGVVGWTVRSFVHVPEGQVFPTAIARSYAPGGYHGRSTPLRGRIVSCGGGGGGTTAPHGVSPTAGYQSDGLHHWCYLLAEDETAGDIAAAITGEEARYQELVLANPDLKTVGIPGKVGPDEWNFAPGSLALGSKLTLPQTWNPWIDELGQPRGQVASFPEDTRVKASTHGYGSPQSHQLAAAHLQPLSPHEPPPYGRAFTYSPPAQA